MAQLGSDLLLGLGIASLTAGIATLTAGGFLTWLNRSQFPPCHTNYTNLGNGQDNWELSNIVIQGEIKKHHNNDILTNSNDISQEEAVLKCNDQGPAGIVTHMGKVKSHSDNEIGEMQWQKVVSTVFKKPGEEKPTTQTQLLTKYTTEFPDPPATFSAPFILSDSQNNEIHIKEIDMLNGFRSVHKDVEIKPFDFPEKTYGDSKVSYTRSHLRYNILPYGITVAILGNAKKVKGKENVTFSPIEVGNTAESFGSAIKLDKYTYTVLIIGGITIIAGVVLLITWLCKCRRRNPHKNPDDSVQRWNNF